MNREKFGKYLQKLRRDKDFTQVELSEILGISHQAISKWEKGDSVPDIDMLKKLCELYTITLDDLINMKIGSIAEQKEIDGYNKLFIERARASILLIIVGMLAAYGSASVLGTGSMLLFGVFLISFTAGFMVSYLTYSALGVRQLKSIKYYALVLTFSLSIFYYFIELIVGRDFYNLGSIIFDTPYFIVIYFYIYQIILLILYKIEGIETKITKKNIINGFILALYIGFLLLVYRWYDEELRSTVGEPWYRNGYYAGMWPRNDWQPSGFLLLIQAVLSIQAIVTLYFKKFKSFIYALPSIVIYFILLLWALVDKSTVDNHWLAEFFKDGVFTMGTFFFFAIVNTALVVYLILKIVNKNYKDNVSIYLVISNIFVYFGYVNAFPYVHYLQESVREFYDLDFYYKSYFIITPYNYTLFYMVIFIGLGMILVDRVKKVTRCD